MNLASSFRRLFGLSLSTVTLAVGASGAAFAQKADRATPAHSTAPTPQAAIAPSPDDKPASARCTPETGSRIPARPRTVAGKVRCDTGANARTYDSSDLERTGETDIGRALEKLDPSISTRR